MISQTAISYQDAVEQGADFSMVDSCGRLRKLAKINRLTVDRSAHGDNPRNRHLFRYIEYCGASVEEYVREYLSNLQPYMLSRLKSQEKEENFVCVLDNRYRVSLYIKADMTKGEEIIVSFHESNKNGIAKENNLIRNQGNIPVVVFADSVEAHVGDTARYMVKIFIQRGMLTLPVTIPATKCDNGTYLADGSVIEGAIVDECNQYIRDLYTSDLDLNMDNVTLFSVLQQISFTSFGRDVFSNISLLIDNLAIQPEPFSRKAADFALTTYCMHTNLDERAKKELAELLAERYSVTSAKNTGAVIERVSTLLLLDQDSQQISEIEGRE